MGIREKIAKIAKAKIVFGKYPCRPMARCHPIENAGDLFENSEEQERPECKSRYLPRSATSSLNPLQRRQGVTWEGKC